MDPLFLGPFRIRAPIGQGGMSEVWSGEHVQHRVQVAVKIMTTKGARDATFQETFRNEVRAASRLDHPGIIALFDYGVISPAQSAETGGRISAGSPYLVMERAERTVSTQDVASWDQVRHLLLSLLDALAHAHAREVIHRDLKPGNILLGSGKQGAQPAWKLTDFGVAHALDRAPRTGSVEDVFGTPAYMAPEQFWGRWRDYGPWTDLYALGILAWRLITGNLPFRAETLVDMAQAHLRLPPPSFTPRFATPDGMEGWLQRLLQKNPFQRYRRAADARWGLLSLGDAEAEAFSKELSEEDDLTAETTTYVDQPVGQALPEAGPAPEAPLTPPEIPSMPRHWERLRQHRTRQLAGTGSGLIRLRVLPLVGRQDERERLWSDLRRVREDGNLRLTLLSGPAGVGKSALAGWFCRRAEEVGAATVFKAVHGPMLGAAEGLPRMVAKALQCVGLTREETLTRLKEQLRARGVEDPYEWRALAEQLHPSPPGDGGGVRFHSPDERYVVIRRLLARLSEDAGFQRPVILWMDDVHWGADALGLVEHLLHAERLDAFPVMVLLTAQDELLSKRPLEAHLLDELMAWPRTEHLRLGPLPSIAMRELIQEHLGLRGDLAEALELRAEGHPQFAMEMVAEWVARGALRPTGDGFSLQPGVSLSLPDSLHQLWQVRIQRAIARSSLSPAALLGPLELLATLGAEVDEVEWRALCKLAGQPPPDGVLTHLQAHDLVERQSGTLAFSHPMIRESLVRMAQEAGRWAHWNQVAARMLQRQGQEARLGGHLLAAGVPEQALAPLLVGAAQALRVCDYRQVFVLLQERDRAMEALEIPEVDPRRVEATLLRARALQETGRLPEAREAAEAAQACARQLTDRQLLGQTLLTQGRVEAAAGALTQATSSYHRAQTLFVTLHDRLGTARALHGMAEVRRTAGEVAEAARLLEEAVDALERLGEPLALAEALTDLGKALRQRSKVMEARACYLQARPIYASLGHQRGVAHCQLGLGAVAELQENYPEAEKQYRIALDLFDGIGHQPGRAAALNGLAEVARALGKLAEAEQGYRAALRAYEAAGQAVSFVSACNLGLVLVARGQPDEARPIFQEALREVEDQERAGWAGAIHAMLLVTAASLPEDWAEHMVGARTHLRATGFADPDIVWSLEQAVQRCLDLGLEDQALDAWLLAMEQCQVLGDAERSARLLTDYPQLVGADEELLEE
ncbi:MAG: tetratricopeptide repeat protein [Deltaproteobacteria bacterium]|nr:tetratricopeptide repeat protein [Deltaproteobacteria bacterium]